MYVNNWQNSSPSFSISSILWLNSLKYRKWKSTNRIDFNGWDQRRSNWKEWNKREMILTLKISNKEIQNSTLTSYYFRFTYNLWSPHHWHEYSNWNKNKSLLPTRFSIYSLRIDVNALHIRHFIKLKRMNRGVFHWIDFVFVVIVCFASGIFYFQKTEFIGFKVFETFKESWWVNSFELEIISRTVKMR